jgi:hypothetical protein
MEAVVINNRVPEYLVETAVSVGQRGNGEQGGKLARRLGPLARDHVRPRLLAFKNLP